MSTQRDSNGSQDLFSSKREQWIALVGGLIGPGLFLVGTLLPKPAGWVVVALALLTGGALGVWITHLVRTRLDGDSGPDPETTRIGDREYVQTPGHGSVLVLTDRGKRINGVCFVAGIVLLGLALAFGEQGPNADWSPLQAVVQLTGVVLVLGSITAPTLNALIRRMWQKAARRSQRHEPVGTDPEKP